MKVAPLNCQLHGWIGPGPCPDCMKKRNADRVFVRETASLMFAINRAFRRNVSARIIAQECWADAQALLDCELES